MPAVQNDDIWLCNGDPRRTRDAARNYALIIRDHSAAIVIWLGLCVTVSLVHGWTTRPEFVATTQIMLEPRIVAQDGPEALRAFHQISIDSDQAYTEQAMITSSRVLRYAFETSGLAGSPEFADDSDGYVTRLLRRWHGVRGSRDGGSEADRRFARFAARVRTRRLASSYSIDITYQAPSAREAARAANAIASAYMREQLTRVASGAQAGAAYHVAQAAALKDEIASVERAVAAGDVPAAALPDANVRSMGPAIAPLKPLFPRLGPLVCLAVVFGAVTAALSAAALRNAGRRVKSERQMVDQVGIDCLVSVGTSPYRRRGLPSALGSEVEVRSAVRGIWASIASLAVAQEPLSIGFAAWNGGPGVSVLAKALAAAMDRAGMPPLSVACSSEDAAESRGSCRSAGEPSAPGSSRVRVMALPPLARHIEIRSVLPTCDAVFLVVEAERTTIAEARAAVRCLQGIGKTFAGVILTPPLAA